MKKIKLPEFIKIAFQSKVDSIVLILCIAVSAVDLFSTKDLTGGFAFFTVFILGCILRMGWWKWQYKHKGEEGFPEIK